MVEKGLEIVLDGNAAAGTLQEFFVPEITIAQIQCDACELNSRDRCFASVCCPHGGSFKVYPLR